MNYSADKIRTIHVLFIDVDDDDSLLLLFPLLLLLLLNVIIIVQAQILQSDQRLHSVFCISRLLYRTLPQSACVPWDVCNRNVHNGLPAAENCHVFNRFINTCSSKSNGMNSS